MSSLARKSLIARLACETLEARETPAVAYTLGAIANGAANLVSFDTATPTVTQTTAITGIASNEQLVGLDFRPQNGHLYALGVTTTSASTNTGTLYDISVRTGRASIVGGTAGQVTTTDGLSNPTTTSYAFDFNPAVDGIRVMATDGDNFVINANTGTTLANQTSVAGGRIYSGTAYTNNSPNVDTSTPVTTEYAIDTTTDVLYRITNTATPGTGDVTVGALGIDASAINGFDIPAGVTVTTSGQAVTSTAVTAFANLNVGGVSRLYTVDLTTGAAALVGTIGTGGTFNGLAVQNDYGGYTSVAIVGATTGSASLVRFNTSTPGTTSTAVTVSTPNETLVGVSYRPATGQLYGLGVNTGTGNGTLYIINPQSGAVTVVGTTGGVTLAATATLPATALPDPAATGYGFAFNATVDAIRIITANSGAPGTAGQSFAISVNGATAGTVAARAPLVSGANVDSALYTNAFGQTAGAGNPTTLYVLDSSTDRLLIMNPATSVATPVATVTSGGTTLNFTAVTGFEAGAGVTSTGPSGTAVQSGVGYATLTVGGVTNLYQINLRTGVATMVTGALTSAATGLTLSDTPGGTVSFASASATGNEGGSVNIMLTRTATTGAQTVIVTAAGGSATPGSDLAATPYLVTFPDGATTATLTIPLTADMKTEGTENLVLTLSVPGGALGTVTATSITINDTSTTPPPPPPFYSGATVVGGNLVIQGTGVSGGMQIVPLPPGSSAFFSDLNGDGRSDLIIITPTLAVVQDGSTGRFLALAADVTGDGVRDLLIFNANGTTTTTNGRTGITVTM